MTTRTRKDQQLPTINGHRLRTLLADVPRIARLLRPENYIGVCIPQSEGAWTRCGPTWFVPELSAWVTVGPGVDSWGTSRGLAQLAEDPAVQPKWHAVGVSITRRENIIFAVSDTVVRDSASFPDIRQLATLAGEYEYEGDL